MKATTMTTTPPAITADFSKQARRQLGLSQRDVIEGTGLPSYKLKQWEARGLDINVADLQTLRAYYGEQAEARGLSFDDIEAHFNAGTEQPQPDTSATRGLDRMGFLISPKISPEVVDQLMADIDAADDRIADIVKAAIQSSMWGGTSSETETQVRELFGHLAANYLRFRCLQGRNIVAPTRDEAQTVGDYLSNWVKTEGVAHVINDEPATDEQE
jgi:hypothetical protein